MSNLVFRHGEPFYFNACVGENGFVHYLTYADGCSKASNILLDQVLSNDGRDVDVFIYPICFNMRHSIELRLKGVIQKLEKLAVIRGVNIPDFNYSKSHDITKIWEYFYENSNNIDSRFIEINDLLGKYIIDIGKVDSTGQVFRYPVDENGAKHLMEVGSINCLHLKHVFSLLERNLNNLDHLANMLIEEYKLNTFTSKLSREQIFEFTKELPKYSDWKLLLTKEYKEVLKKKFNIGSNDLTKAVNIVKRNYELNGLIGNTKPLLACSNNEILNLCVDWVKHIKPGYKEFYNGNIEIIHLSNDDLTKSFSKMIDATSYCSNIIEELSIDCISDLWALFYLSRDDIKYSEMYEMMFEEFKREITARGNTLESFKHVFMKSIFWSIC